MIPTQHALYVRLFFPPHPNEETKPGNRKCLTYNASFVYSQKLFKTTNIILIQKPITSVQVLWTRAVLPS